MTRPTMTRKRYCIKCILFFSLALVLCATYKAALAAETEVSELSEHTYRAAKRTIVVIFDEPTADPRNPKELLTNAIGTGFLVSIPGKTHHKTQSISILVTNKHVISSRNRLLLRFNDAAQNGSRMQLVDIKAIGLDRNLFLAQDPSVDLAAIELSSFPEGADHLGFSPELILDESQWERLEIEEGTEVFSLGLLLNYPGLLKNLPVLRFGRIALLSNEKWFTGQCSGLKEKAFLADLNTTFGTSGSPVMLVPTASRVSQKSGQIEVRRTYLFILGVIKGAPGTPAGSVLETGKPVSIPQPLTAIEPSSSLRTFLNEIVESLKLRGFEAEPFRSL
jgi:hypothetical protein